MARMAPTPPSVVADCEKSSEEEDLLRRSKKKVRAWDEVDGSDSPVQEMVLPLPHSLKQDHTRINC